MYIIYIDKKRITKKKITEELSYSFYKGTLKLFKDEVLVNSEPAELWDGFVIIDQKDETIIQEYAPSPKRGAVVEWLLGIKKKNRASSEEEYSELCEKIREKLRNTSFTEETYSTHNYVITELKDSETDIISFVKDTITNEEIVELIPKMNSYPKKFLEKILKDKLGIKTI